MLVDGSACWRSAGERNLALQSDIMTEAERCAGRFMTLIEAQRACAAQRSWCGGVVQDNGLRCNVHGRGEIHPFELRRAKALQNSRTRATWLLVRTSSPATGLSADSCREMAGQEQAREVSDANRHAAERRFAVGAAWARRERHAANKTLRCSEALGVRALSGELVSPDWRTAHSPMEEKALLARRSICPEDWLVLWHTRSRGSTPPHHGGCCVTTNVTALVYDPCEGGERPTVVAGVMDPKQRRATVKRAADDLKGQRVLVIGDSVSSQWAAALALDLHGRGLFSDDNAPLRQSVAGTPSHWCGAPNGADWVLQGASLHFTLASFSVRRLKNTSVSSPTCPWEGDDLFAGMGPRHRSTVERVLREFQPSVIVANMGIHYDSREMNLVETDGEYARSLHVLFSLLTSYQASAPVRPNLKPNLKTKADASRPPLVLFRETFPQHFWTERYDGSYFEQERASNARFLATLDVPPGACSASLWSERDPEHQARLAAVHDGPYAINRIARAVLSEYPSIRPLAQFNRMAQQPHMHVSPNEGRDCTHFCYHPLLWDAPLAPFYSAVVDWASRVLSSRPVDPSIVGGAV